MVKPVADIYIKVQLICTLFRDVFNVLLYLHYVNIKIKYILIPRFTNQGWCQCNLKY